jgi:hypothetical protein
MRAGEIVFTGMDRVVFGRPAAEAVAEAVERLGAKPVFILDVPRLYPQRHLSSVKVLV